MMMRRVSLIVMAAALVFASGCPAKKKEISSLQRKEAETLVSEAQFALTIRDYARAEGLFAKAAELCPDTGSYWISLGATRMRLGNRSGAKDAYEGGLKAFQDLAAEEKADAEPWLQQIYALAVLGRTDDSRALLEKAASRFPDDRKLQQFIEAKQLDRTLADPKFKEVAL